MSQQQQTIAQTVQLPALESTKQRTGAHRQIDLTLDLIIIEAGLRLKVLPLRDAALRGRQLSFGEAERRMRQRVLFDISGYGTLRIVDVGLFADAVARRPDVAEQLWRALRSHAPGHELRNGGGLFSPSAGGCCNNNQALCGGGYRQSANPPLLPDLRQHDHVKDDESRHAEGGNEDQRQFTHG